MKSQNWVHFPLHHIICYVKANSFTKVLKNRSVSGDAGGRRCHSDVRLIVRGNQGIKDSRICDLRHHLPGLALRGAGYSEIAVISNPVLGAGRVGLLNFSHLVRLG